MGGNESYIGLSCETRIRLLGCFGSFAARCPISHMALSYRKDHYLDDEALFARMRRDLVLFLFDHLTGSKHTKQLKSITMMVRALLLRCFTMHSNMRSGHKQSYIEIARPATSDFSKSLTTSANSS